jgi:hypothetical protein
MGQEYNHSFVIIYIHFYFLIVNPFQINTKALTS